MLISPYLPFIIGNDICRIARVRRILKGRLGPQFVRRILRTEEIQHASTAKILRCILEQNAQSSRDAQPMPKGVIEAQLVSTRDAPGLTRAVEFMAGRFAAKEAVIKAHPHRRLTFQRIAILRATDGLVPAGTAREPKGGMAPRPDEEDTASTTHMPQSGPLVALIRAEDEDGVLRDGDDDDTYASVSISHDTDYATAVCLGVNRTSRMWGGLMGGIPK